MQEKRKDLVLRYLAAYNTFDVDRMMAHLSPDLVFENISNGTVNLRTEGVEAFRQQAKAATAYFSEWKLIAECPAYAAC
ncbi:nuclear transport factor 2 family protein [Lewinella sp. IMCC34191]|uniref:nuclear transport factor 2 family protein n=1 Tax=Lewinella sp. IMCC34191 TaxID=2259172 RepID=UPI001300BC4D|nr:nuclear transport factor 2 family protein [Lewinella sp. IMCC34191]